ncbi:RagB/SusD family nutrient uptake outer membrane protein [Chryseosolibacter indicus]|uniref:RagB/SusD family nutrient uptake outer membrane protein n=1 Tax=Chryseosolibacter indicus TaxID=2782351 RepID=A0ABS5VNZ6_9BACT|nr:RagB/SusD family nutrient uptake outer membrane protein [Chryseosolibacter indicus]MBT1703158.1 RagB/SusD family nutrient uptake outer membrane protein [Chryseosolibacter indicus]
MKKHSNKFMAILLTTVMLFSCNDYLDFEPENTLPGEEFFVNPEQAEQSIVAIYGYMRAWEMVGFAPMILQEITTDNTVKGSSLGDAAYINDFNFFNYTPDLFVINDYWTGRYRGINLANQALSNIPKITMDESRKARLIAEAKFARALFYFDLVRAFGDISLPTTVENTFEESLLRRPKAEAYALIIQDLKDAIAVLPPQYGPGEIGRATVWSARGLLAKVYLYQEQWDLVLEQTSAIISSGQFGLLEDFYQVFRIENENSVESIFEIQAQAVAGNADLSNSQYSQVQGVRGTNGFGWGFNIPTDDLANAFDAAGDTERKNATLLYKGVTTPDGDRIEGVGENELEGITGLPRYNGKSYVPRKHQIAGVTEGSEQNIRVLRYSEVLLIDAEAKVSKGDVGGAATSLNEVRKRASLSEITSPTLQDIWNERRLELALENDRFFDLVRTGQAPAVLGPLGFVAGKHEVFPIPQRAIDANRETMTQNFGY